jgi:predicted nucleic acid-binding protein
MILVDTSVWVEYLKGHQPYLDVMDPLLEDRQILALEPVFGELLQGAKDDRERRILLELWGNLPKSPLHGAWVKAGELSSRNKWLDHGIGLIDSVLIYTARESKAKVWTLDKKLISVLNKNERFG